MRQPLMTLPDCAMRLDDTPEGRRSLDAILAPRSAAVIGAIEEPESIGQMILKNLSDRPFLGSVYPVGSRYASIPVGLLHTRSFELKSYPRIAEVPESIDLAVIAVPAPLVPEIVGQCVDVGVRGAIITSARSRGAGAEDVAWEREILAEARRGRLRFLGPDSFGVMCPFLGLNATPADAMAQPGHVAFLSQSRALCSAVLDWSLRERIGFSALVSVGSMLDVGWGDLIGHLGDDPRTTSIIIYMEAIDDPRSLLSAAQAVAPRKPIIVLKSGRPASPAEGDEVLDAAFRRCGVLRVRRLSELFAMAEVLAKQPRPRGPRLTIVTNGDGPGVLAADALVANGGVLAPLALRPSRRSTRGCRPKHPATTRSTCSKTPTTTASPAPSRAAAADPNTDGLLVILTPHPMADATSIAERLRRLDLPEGKPILASWMGGAQVLAGEDLLNRAGICTFEYPDTAARAFCYLWKYSDNLRAMDETLAATAATDADTPAPDLEAAVAIARAVQRSGRTLLDVVESLRLLATYGLPTLPTSAASSAEEAVCLARAFDSPVALRTLTDPLASLAVAHGVRRDLADAESIRCAYSTLETLVRQKAGPDHFRGVIVQPMIEHEGYKLFAGSRTDPQFGPVLLFGFGGRLSEVFKDRSIALPPLTPTLARRMMERTRIYQALKGEHGRAPVALASLERFLVRLGRLVIEQPWIKQIDINPLFASPERLLALDARVVTWGSEVPEDQRPRPALWPEPVLGPTGDERPTL